jgi:hypothetical protein
VLFPYDTEKEFTEGKVSVKATFDGVLYRAREILLDEELGGATPERLAALKAANESAGTRRLRLKRIELNKKAAGKESSNAYDIAIDCAAVGV